MFGPLKQLYDDEVCAVKNCQLFSPITQTIKTKMKVMNFASFLLAN